VLLSGGYGAGKTQALALKTLHLRHMNPGVPGLLVAPNWRTMWGVTYRRLREILRKVLSPAEMPVLKDRQGECYLDFGDDAPIFLRSARNHDGFDGLDVGWAAGDEARYWTEKSYNVVQGRVRKKCPHPQLALVSTPQMGWLSNEFNSGKTQRQLIIAPTRENEANLAPGFIENIKASYSQRMWRALIDGIFTILEGAVFEAFDPNPATSPWLVDFEPKKEWLAQRRNYLAVDPGFRRSAWIWVVQTGEAEWMAYDQLMLDSHSDIAAVQKVNAKGWPIDEIWCDPAAGNTQSFEGADSLRALQAIKTRSPKGAIRTITAANREIAFGVDKMRVLLGDNETQPIRFKFAKRLVEQEKKLERGIVKDTASLRYPEHKEGKPMVNYPLKDGVTDHSTDAGRYLITGLWLCNPKLRQLDHELAKNPQPGWKVAA
jgi:hypothetical protein